MSEIVIRAENLSKRYRIGQTREKYKTLRDTIANAAQSSWRGLQSLYQKRSGAKGGGDGDQIFWALNEVSFEVRRGEVVGIIGRNGAGKTTLLKILARITEPTSGYVDVSGRIGALLEVGTGFHQELTGRENIYLSGAILGMRREEINRKLEEIIEFAEVSKFIDTPVKRYSTGMYLRLAFSVAAHLEPEILLVDEVLAVGDVAFQKKCIGKMEDVASEGRTVLFVSHNLAVIKEMCDTSIVMNDGQNVFRGPVVEGLSHYSQIISAKEPGRRGGAPGITWRQVKLNGLEFGLAPPIEKHEEFFIEAWLDLSKDLGRGYLYCIINDAIGNQVVHQRIETTEMGFSRLETGSYHVRIGLPRLWLAPGAYTAYFKFIGVGLEGEAETHLSERILIDVIGATAKNSAALLAPDGEWSLEPHA